MLGIKPWRSARAAASGKPIFKNRSYWTHKGGIGHGLALCPGVWLLGIGALLLTLVANVLTLEAKVLTFGGQGPNFWSQAPNFWGPSS